ncbi:MAG: Rv3235 family protein [Actinobacteria bacterium]|nr:Rv3235 family protein [Actinomycetota bacterium]
MSHAISAVSVASAYSEAPVVQSTARAIPAYEPPLEFDAAADPEPIDDRQLELDLRPPASSATILTFPSSRMREPEPELAQWAKSLIQATLEALHGARSPMQLRKWFAAPVHAALVSRSACIARSTSTPPRITVRSVRTSVVSTGRVEASAVVDVAGRCRAVALQLQMYDGRWRVTALEMA